jgi:hypothetical protein
VAVWSAAVSSSAPRAEAQREPAPGTADLERTITQYCAGCHNQRVQTTATASGVVLDHVDLSQVVENSAMWEKVVRKLRAGAMPPAGMPRPDGAAHAALISFLANTLDRAAASRPRPGRPSPHRLNRAEYANAVRDLLALNVDPSALLPADDSADGFDAGVEGERHDDRPAAAGQGRRPESEAAQSDDGADDCRLACRSQCRPRTEHD